MAAKFGFGQVGSLENEFCNVTDILIPDLFHFTVKKKNLTIINIDL